MKVIRTGTLKNGVGLYKVDWRAMERNKYAPWGRQAY